jgi:hypothetical protein
MGLATAQETGNCPKNGQDCPKRLRKRVTKGDGAKRSLQGDDRQWLEVTPRNHKGIAFWE